MPGIAIAFVPHPCDDKAALIRARNMVLVDAKGSDYCSG
jgi:hypothetical protein